MKIFDEYSLGTIDSPNHADFIIKRAQTMPNQKTLKGYRRALKYAIAQNNNQRKAPP